MNNSINLIVLIVLVVFTSCVGEEGPIVIKTDGSLEVSFSDDIQPIFNNNCIQCHNDNHITGLDLREGMSYDLLVNISSTNYAPTPRIEPFSLENSVIWHKINDDGVFGGQMPPTQMLSNFEIQKIEAWIESGALNN